MKYLEKLYIDAFVLSIFGAVGVATLLPATGAAEDVLDWVVKFAIGLLFFLYGTRLSPGESLEGLKHWRLHGVVLAATFGLFPVIGLLLGALEPRIITPDLYRGILFMCLVPSTVQSSIAFTSIAKGNVSAAIVSASFSNLAGVFVTPLLVILLMDTTGQAHVDLSSVVNILLQILFPFLLGQLSRPLLTGWVTRHRPLTNMVDRGSILLVVYAAFSEGMNENIWSTISFAQVLLVVVISLAVLAAVLAITWIVGRELGFSVPDQVVIIFCGSKKSLATGVPMASVLFAGYPVGLVVLPLMIFHQIQLVACAALAQHFAKLHDRRVARTPVEITA